VTGRRQRGFTLIELMVALLVSSLLVGMILAIFSRMSIAYRGQQQIAGVQQVLAAARATIELDARQAGLEMAQGFKIFNEPAGKLHSPVTITNSSTGPDQIAFFYADTSIQAVVTTGGSFPGGNSLDLVNVDPVGGFLPDDLVVLVKPDAIGGGSGIGPNDALIANYDACVLQVATASSGQVTLATNGLWSNGIFNYCPDPASGPMLYKFVARAYRIDPSQPGLGVLQQSPTGGLLGNANDNWTPLAFGFTDLQAALQIYDGNAADLDGDGLVDREWYSGDAQRAQTDPVVQPVKLPIPLQISISLVARTDRDVEGISTAQTPELTEAGLVPLPWPTCCTRDNNPLGDHPSVPLPSTDPTLLGARIYRYITFQVDFRNLGVGR
jgi:prepilin-type N-terminal cleavage/methylation domain-containing protein